METGKLSLLASWKIAEEKIERLQKENAELKKMVRSISIAGLLAVVIAVASWF